jgi:hypothetical protein
VNWLTPLVGLWLAVALIPPLLLLYFLKLRRRPKPIACTLLWKRSVEDLQANAPFQKLRRNLLLFLQLLALAFLILSVMQPQVLADRGESGKTILLIDNSASMTATDGEDEATRLVEAKHRAKERIEALYAGGLFSRSGGETMIIGFSDRAEIACRFSTSKQELLSAVDRIRPTHGGSELDEALKLARAYTTNVDPDSDRPVGEPADLELFSDGRIADLGDQVLRGETLRYHRIGSPEADNVAIATMSVERPYDRPSAVEVFVALLNFNEAEVQCDLELRVDNRARALEELTLPPATTDDASGELVPGRNNIVFTPFEEPRGAVIEVRNLRADELAADDTARVVVPPPKQLTVGLVAPKSFLIRSVLEGMPLRSIEILTEAQYERLAERGVVDAYDVIVFDNYAPPQGSMVAGRFLSFGATPPLKGLEEFGADDAQIVLNIHEEHPVFRYVDLDKLFIAEGKLVQVDDDVEVLAEGTQGPVVVQIGRGPLQHIHVTFDPLRSNWPFQRSFVTFIFNAIDYLGHVGEGLTTEGFRIGEALSTRVPSAATDIRLRTPDGNTIPLRAMNETSVSWGPLRFAGLYTLAWQMPDREEPVERNFAVNLSAEREGAVAAAEQITIGRKDISGGTADAAGYMPLWPWAVGLCLVVLMLEWWVYHRKTFL